MRRPILLFRRSDTGAARAQVDGHRRSRWRRAFAGLRGDERGIAVVEFGLTALPFFFLVCLVIETAMFMWADQVLDVAVQKAARFVITGEAQTSGWSREQLRQKVCDAGGGMFTCSKISIEVNVYDSFNFTNTRPVDKDGNFTAANLVYKTACPGKIATVRAFYKWPTVAGFLWGSLRLTYADQGDGTRLLAAATAFRAEPYPKPASGC